MPADDGDGDGYLVCDDCDDGNADVYPGAPELTCDGVANDCDGGGEFWVPTDLPTIQDAIAAAADNDVVCVEAGTYVERIDLLGKAITVHGVEGPLATIIDGDDGGSVVTMDNGEDQLTVLEGLTITNGYAGWGGGIRAGGAEPVLRDLVISDNVGSSRGGGIWFDGGSPTLTNVSFLRNRGYMYAGAVHIDSGSPTFDNVAFADNYNSNTAGAVFVGSDASAVFNNVLFSGNYAGSRGGAMDINGSNASATLNHVSFVGNESAYWGGGIYISNGHVDISHCIFAHNSAPSGGGAIQFYGSPTQTIEYTDIWDNSPNDYANIADPTGVDGNLAEDPQFLDLADADPYYWDVHLATGSALVDAGDPGLADPDGSIADMGGYSGTGAGSFDLDADGYPQWWQPGPYDVVRDPGDGWDCDDLDPAVYPGNGC